MSDDMTKANILNGIAEGMEKEADRDAREEQSIRNKMQPLGRIVPEEEQERLNTITASMPKNISHDREIAAQLRRQAQECQEL